MQIKTLLDDILSALPDEFNMHEIQQKIPVEERTPYTIVAFQECERMNQLTTEMKRSLKELDLGLKVGVFLSACGGHCHCVKVTVSETSYSYINRYVAICNIRLVDFVSVNAQYLIEWTHMLLKITS